MTENTRFILGSNEFNLSANRPIGLMTVKVIAARADGCILWNEAHMSSSLWDTCYKSLKILPDIKRFSMLPCEILVFKVHVDGRHGTAAQTKARRNWGELTAVDERVLAKQTSHGMSFNMPDIVQAIHRDVGLKSFLNRLC